MKFSLIFHGNIYVNTLQCYVIRTMPQLLSLHRVEINIVQTLKYAYLATKKRKNLMYVCPCIIYEIEERYPLDATIYLLL